jgi:hypothetical protein
MNAERDVIVKLGQLSESDRSWILSRLPASARSRLLSVEPSVDVSATLEDGKKPAASSPAEDEVLAQLHRADPGAIAEVLHREPTYLTAAFVMTSNWPWRAEFLNLLPPAQRAEIAATASMIELTPAMSQALSRAIAARLEHSSPTPQRALSRFEALVEQIGAARSRRRLIRL